MNVSAAGMKMIQGFEGLRLTTYKDIVGIPTIGYGSTGKDVKMGMTITKAQAEDMMRADLERFEEAVLAPLNAKPTQNQFDAMVSLAYNIGAGAFTESTLVRKFNKGDVQGAANEFLRWNRAGQKVVDGLTRRRHRERDHFLGTGA
jgi:Phage-related lysozyme (muraminidase)